jgi:hypothetical protein
MTKNLTEKTIAGKKFVIYKRYKTQWVAKRVAAGIRREVPYKGYLVRVVLSPYGFYNEYGDWQFYWGIYIHDGTKKPWRT